MLFISSELSIAALSSAPAESNLRSPGAKHGTELREAEIVLKKILLHIISHCHNPLHWPGVKQAENIRLDPYWQGHHLCQLCRHAPLLAHLAVRSSQSSLLRCLLQTHLDTGSGHSQVNAWSWEDDKLQDPATGIKPEKKILWLWLSEAAPAVSSETLTSWHWLQGMMHKLESEPLGCVSEIQQLWEV